jgi:ATP-binding cassette, subfamily B, bacterial
MPFPFHRQPDAMDCGPACLRMIAEHHGRRYSLPYLREHSHLDREGVSMQGILLAAEHIGFRAIPVKIPFDEADSDTSLMNAPLPCIVHWEDRHFIVVFKITKRHMWVADPERGKLKLSHATFKKGWLGANPAGIALLLEPTPDLYSHEMESPSEPRPWSGFGFMLQYLRPFRRLLGQLSLGLLLASLLQFLFPFLTQAIVDVGIENQDLHFIWLILSGQLMLFAGQAAVRYIQNWIVLHIGARVNVSLVSDFLEKLMLQPLRFFDAKMTGDLLQRIGDHRRIEEFLTISTMNILFSVFTLLIFGAVLAVYSLKIFFIFAVASLCYAGWIVIFLKKRADADFLRFQALTENQSNLIELIQGMQEIKLQNSERKRRYAWVHIQAQLFQANMRSLRIGQWQEAGAQFIAQVKDIFITVVAAAAVIDGQITLGMMLAIMFITGQLNVPLQQITAFVRAAQDARMSLERLAEVSGKQPAVRSPQSAVRSPKPAMDGGKKEENIAIEALSFRYNALAGFVLKNINLEIPAGKVTAIVGPSGSGKTTLIKLLLGFYEPSEGTIKTGAANLNDLPPDDWRSRCGAVMQDGFVFSDTLLANITESDPAHSSVDENRLRKAVQTAHLLEFIESLPMGYHTMVGARGNGLSQGQRQRLLIARAVYKEPQFLFFDEATNALDARNEKIIMENLNRFFTGRTVVIVAHRLSTVKNAANIVVLENGELIEQGTHEKLVRKKGAYYTLVKEQLELGGE